MLLLHLRSITASFCENFNLIMFDFWQIFPNAQAADPICTLIFSVIIIFTTAQVGKDSVWLLMQGSPCSPVTRDNLSIALKEIPGVRHVHDVNIWSLAPGRNVVTAHLAAGKFIYYKLAVEFFT